MGTRYCIGIDIGGTTVKMGLFTVEGRLVEKWEIPTRHEDAGGHILEDVAASLKKKLADEDYSWNDVAGVGLDVPGPVQPDGYVSVCVNLGWMDLYPAQELSKLLGGGINCYVGNDANVAALGEMWQGGGKGHKNLMLVTLGTGVGGGVVVDSKIVTGAHGAGGEFGHIHIREDDPDTCNCGGRGCLEQTASATGIVREAKNVLKASDDPSAMRQFGDALTAKDVCDCAKAGDSLALKAMNTCCRYLGWGLSIICMTTDPEVIVIGGGVSKTGQWLCDLIQSYMNPLTPLLADTQKAKVVLAQLGNDAGIYGSARLVLGSELGN